jgi:hypothetical protein
LFSILLFQQQVVTVLLALIGFLYLQIRGEKRNKRKDDALLRASIIIKVKAGLRLAPSRQAALTG